MKRAGRLLALILCLALCLGVFAGCSRFTALPELAEPTPTPVPTPAATPDAAPDPADRDYLAVGYVDLTGHFSPFYAETEADIDIARLTSVSLMETDLSGQVAGDSGLTSGKLAQPGVATLSVAYDQAADTTAYTWTLRDGVTFSDGEALTADDVVFSYYVYCDYAYDGPAAVSALPIVGLRDYRTQTTAAVYDRYAALFDAIYALGRDHALAAGDNWTQAQQDAVWAAVDGAWVSDVQDIVDYCVRNYLNSRAEDMGYTADEILENPGLQVAFGMWLWGYGEFYNTAGGFRGVWSDTTWDLKTEFPTAQDFCDECRLAYGNNHENYWSVDSVSDQSVTDRAREDFIRAEGSKDPSLGGAGVPNIAGIQKTGDSSVTVTLSGNVPDAHDALDIAVAPLHYYGDESQYDYESSRFGFPAGDLSGIWAKDGQPLGAGPYTLAGFGEGTARLLANADYYLGAPNIQEIQFVTVSESQRVTALRDGVIDIGRLSLSPAEAAAIASANEAEEETAVPLITAHTYGTDLYGYIGANAAAVKVGSDPASEESRALRKAFATVFAVYREEAAEAVSAGLGVDTGCVTVSATPIALPYGSLNYDTNAEGGALYTGGMDRDARYAVAMGAAVEYLRAAGYTWDEEAGKLTAAPEGAALAYTLYLPGTGDDYAALRALANLAAEALAEIGITLTVTDVTSAAAQTTVHFRAGLWDAAAGDDMYGVYHSAEGSFGNMQSAELDALVEGMMASTDSAYLKTACNDAAAILADWAVLVPAFRDCDCLAVSSINVDPASVSTAMTLGENWTVGVLDLALK